MNFFKLKTLILTSLTLTFFTNALASTSSEEDSGCDDNRADYVIVGVGTAGGLLANRLSADRKTSVIALHSGLNLSRDPLIKFSRNAVFTVSAALLGALIPFNFDEVDFATLRPEIARLLSLPSTGVPFLYETGNSVPQPYADDRSLLWAIGLPLGGASSINAGVWCRGTNQLYAQWEAIAGSNWSVDRILEIYKELENYRGKSTNPEFRGYHGPIDVLQVKRPSNISKTFSEALIQATDTSFVLDYNDPETPIGVSPQVQLTQSGPRGVFRVSSATAFLNKKVMTPSGIGIGGRKLRVHFDSFALKVIWEGDKAIGVEYKQDGEIKQVFANKGVIVSAGLRSSPFLLSSGVGPRSLLESLEIPVIFDNPNVGQGLADQPGIRLLFATPPEDTPVNSNTFFSSISWLPAPGGNPNIRELRFSTAFIIPGLTLGLFDLCQPKSRGTVSINSANPAASPVINLGILSNSDDLALFQSGFSVYIKNMVAALQEINPEYELIFPDPAILDDPLLLSMFIQNQVETNQHFQSHCRMAPLDQGGVVDSTGHVYGVNNLIVADDSIVPQDMDGSPMASAYLIAANIARLLGY